VSELTRAGEYADLLRALGQWLDEQGAARAQIVDCGAFLAVHWSSANGFDREQVYNELDLRGLLTRAHQLRGFVGDDWTSSPLSDRAELLRSLGQDLDDDQVVVDTISEEDDAFVVSGTCDGEYFRVTFGFAPLRLESAQRRRARARARIRSRSTPGGLGQGRWRWFMRWRRSAAA